MTPAPRFRDPLDPGPAAGGYRSLAIGHGNVQFLTAEGDAVTVLMGDGVAQLSGGIGGWTAEERPGLDPAIIWANPDPIRQTIPLMLWDNGDPCGWQYWALWEIGRPRGQHKRPKVCTISGPAIWRPDLEWVIESMEGGETVRRAGDGRVVRMALDVTLMRYVGVDTIVERSPAKRNRDRKKSSPNRGKASNQRRDKVHVVKAGETLSRIAADELGNANRWKEIASLNNIRDPRAIKPGQRLRLP